MKFAARNEGIASLWTVILITLFVAFTGLAIDTGYLVWTGQKLQIGADAAALAGAQRLRYEPAMVRPAAINVALANSAAGEVIQLRPNDGNAPDGDVVIGRFDRDTGVFDSTSGFPNAVMVQARRNGASLGGPVDLLFGKIMGFDTSDVGRRAIAIVGGGTGVGLLVLDSTGDCALFIRGNPTVDLDGGAIIVKSDDLCAACFQGSPEIDASMVITEGEVCERGNIDDADLPDEYYENVDDTPDDPLELLPEPWWDPDDPDLDLGTITDDGTNFYEPGYYSGGIDLTGGDIFLEPGIYVLDGDGLHIRGNTNFTAEGVMLYITGTGIVDLSGTGSITMTPPDPVEYGAMVPPTNPDYETYEGVTVFQDRENDNEGTILGTSDFAFEGTWYFPRNKINVGGTAGDEFKLGDQFIAWQVEIFGNGLVQIASQGFATAPGNRVFLVR